MACKCGESQSCACTVQSGFRLTVTGSGTERSPFRLAATLGLLNGLNTATVLVSAEGTGTKVDPRRLSMRMDPDIVEAMWGSWVGTQAQYDALIPDATVLHVVTSPTRHLPGVENLYVDTDRVVRVYRGATMVADDTGTTLGPGT